MHCLEILYIWEITMLTLNIVFLSSKLVLIIILLLFLDISSPTTTFWAIYKIYFLYFQKYLIIFPLALSKKREWRPIGKCLVGTRDWTNTDSSSRTKKLKDQSTPINNPLLSQSTMIYNSLDFSDCIPWHIAIFSILSHRLLGGRQLPRHFPDIFRSFLSFEE